MLYNIVDHHVTSENFIMNSMANAYANAQLPNSKGWFCGNIRIVRQDSNSKQTNVNTSTDGTSLSSIQGLPITREWIHRAAHIIHHSQKDKTRTGIGDDSSSTSSSTSTNSSQESGCGMDNESSNEFKLHHEANFAIQSDAQCIIVAEKEGVYTRLSEDRFFDRVPCILVTGKGTPYFVPLQ
jgi:hypothetical protein